MTSSQLVSSPSRDMALILRMTLLLGSVNFIHCLPSNVTCMPCVCTVTAKDGIIADCSNKMLKSVPKNISSAVSTLLMSNNSIELAARSFDRFSFMEYLDLSDNALTSLNVDSFVGAANLKRLNLHGNRILLNSKSYPKGAFRQQKKLHTLDIAGNTEDLDAKYPDACLGDLVALRTLIIDGVKNAIFGKGFAKLKNLTTLILSGKRGHCSIYTLYNESFLNTPNVRHLDISYCGVSFIETNAFGPMRNIDMLDLSHNHGLGFETLGNSLFGLQFSPLRVLKFNSIMKPFAIGVELKGDHLRYIDNLTLTELHCDANRIELLDAECAKKLRKVQIVSAKSNRFTYGQYLLNLAVMTNLRKIYLMNQYPSDPLQGDKAVHGERTHLTPMNSVKKKTELTQQPATSQSPPQQRPVPHNDINIVSFQTENNSRIDEQLQKNIMTVEVTEIETIPVLNSIPPNVTFVNLSHSRFDYSINEIGFYPNQVKVLDLSRNSFTGLVGPIHGVDSLEFLDFTDNNCKLLSPTFLMYASSLKVLNISKNYLYQSLKSDIKGHIFFNLTNLEILRISNNLILDLPLPIFQRLNNLQILDLSWNMMEAWTVIISHMSFLTSLDLSNNRFEYVPKSLTDQINLIMNLRNDTFHLNIQGNDLICDCSTLEFLEALSESRISIDRPDDTRCRLNNGERMKFNNIKNIVWRLQKQCKTVVPLLAATLSGVVAFMLIVAAGIIYRYRWKLRYLYYTTRRKYRGYQRLGEGEDNFTYDAFVSYADEDRGFVVEDMRNMLERHHGLRLCIHHRDFMVGEAITANIMNAVQSSRKTIVVLSSNFLKSKWCDYEVHMAKLESIHTGRDVLCVVWYAELPDNSSLSRDLQDEVQYGTYIRYPTAEDEKLEFWENLKAAISY
ncbi:toll-like receptor 4 [Haliotis rufescens]|uniref:toll-like receptor 4 n=1 Tax=Haliotis rufescens TaxID=6454 RepID=UPI00201F6B84|nr:toll-like receptor 4 [Haliotis rufescens]